mmetsp:Transcript_50672/g.120668  ORF Transcript_50672/g.120668 Transcript_50672/m.120668 type:complete len:255 (+) Transcript_50672:2023-2787(+)
MQVHACYGGCGAVPLSRGRRAGQRRSRDVGVGRQRIRPVGVSRRVGRDGVSVVPQSSWLPRELARQGYSRAEVRWEQPSVHGHPPEAVYVQPVGLQRHGLQAEADCCWGLPQHPDHRRVPNVPSPVPLRQGGTHAGAVRLRRGRAVPRHGRGQVADVDRGLSRLHREGGRGVHVGFQPPRPTRQQLLGQRPSLVPAPQPCIADVPRLATADQAQLPEEDPPLPALPGHFQAHDLQSWRHHHDRRAKVRVCGTLP